MSRTFSAAQRRAFDTMGRELSVSAGAGSGKTTVLVERFIRAVVDSGISPERILAVTFTEKAASEMKTRLVAACRERGLSDARRALENAMIGTIHSFCARTLRENPVEAGVDPFFRVMTQGEADILAERALDRVLAAHAEDEAVAGLYVHNSEELLRKSVRVHAQRWMAQPDGERLLSVPKKDPHAMAKAAFARLVHAFRAECDAAKRAANAYDFDDLVRLTHRLFTSDKAPARAVLERTRRQYALVLVDEYQDVSLLQDQIIHRVKSDANLFMVGDVQQSIYGFRQAAPHVFRAHIERHGRRKDAENIRLTENYRSRAEILAFVNAFFSERMPGGDFMALKASKEHPEPKHPPVSMLCYARPKGADDADAESSRRLESRAVAAHILELSGQGRRWKDIAVLMRSMTGAPLYEQAFLEAGIPFVSVKGMGFYQRSEITDALSLLTVLDRPEDDIALAAVLRSPLCGLSEDALVWLAEQAKRRDDKAPLAGAVFGELPEQLADADRHKLAAWLAVYADLRGCKERLGVDALLERAFDATDYEARLLATPGGLRRTANIRKLRDMASQFAGVHVCGVEDFVRHVRRLAEDGPTEQEARLESGDADAVLLSTVHAAKGLEFPVVIIADMGALPRASTHGGFFGTVEHGLGIRLDEKKGDDIYERNKQEAAAAQEQEAWRMLYVAMTRAAEQLVLSGGVRLDTHGAYEDKGPWMHRIAHALGWAPGAEKALHYPAAGIDVALLSLPKESASAAGAKARSEQPMPTADELAARLDMRFRGYEETEDQSVTRVVEADRGAQLEDVEPMPMLEAEDEPRTPANEYGTLFHRYMELCAPSKPSRLTRDRRFMRLTAPLSAAERERFFEEASAFWKGPWGRQLREAERIYTELPFLYATPKGVLKGQIDLVFRDREGRWTILDYKTGDVPSKGWTEKAREHSLQLGIYALVFERLYGVRPARGVLYFSRAAKAHETAYDAELLRSVEQRLAAAYAKASTLDF